MLEDIFYAIIALYIAEKPINEENVRILLQKKSIETDNYALEIVLKFVELLKKRTAEIKNNDNLVDPRIVKFFKNQVLHKIGRAEQFKDLSEFFPEKDEINQNVSVVNRDSRLKDTPESINETDRNESITDSDDQPGDIPESCDEMSQNESVVDLDSRPADVQESIPLSNEDGTSAEEQMAFYMYGVVKAKADNIIDYRGIDDEKVFTIKHRDLCALVHVCETKPYESQQESIVSDWILAHQNILDLSKKAFDDIIPMRFDTIIKTEGFNPPEKAICEWLENNYDELIRLLNKFAGNDEYGIRVTYDVENIMKNIEETSELVKRLKEETSNKPKGMTYFYKEKLDQAVRSEIKSFLENKARSFLEKINENCIELVEEKPQAGNESVLLKVSCLAGKDRINELGNALDEINSEEGFGVIFTGPWPPYSFVEIQEKAGERK